MAESLRVNHKFTSPVANTVFFRDVGIYTVTGFAVGGGTLTQAKKHQTDVYIVNVTGSTVALNSAVLTTGTKFSVVFPGKGALPFDIASKENVLMKALFHPVDGDENTLLSDTLTLTPASGDVVTVPLTGWARSPGQPLMSLAPSVWDFNWVNSRDLLAGIPIGDVSNVFNLLIVSSGTELLEVHSISAFWPFKLVEPYPVLPAVLAPGSSMLVSFICYPSLVGANIYSDSIEIVTNSAMTPVDHLVVNVTGIGVTSAHTLAGTSRKSLAAQGAVIEQFDTSNFNPETTARLKKTVDMSLPHIEKFIAKLRTVYENLGVASMSLVITTKDAVHSTITINLGNSGADGRIREALSDIKMSEAVFELVLTHVSGKISIVKFGLDYEAKGQVIDD